MVDEEVSSRKEWKELCRKLSDGQERAMDSMERLSTEYALLQDKPKQRKVVEETNKLEIEFLDTNDKEQVFLVAQRMSYRAWQRTLHWIFIDATLKKASKSKAS